MNKEIILHHISSAIAIILYYAGLQYLVAGWVPTLDILVLQSGLHRIWIVTLLLLVYFVIPTLIYSLLKYKLLPLLRVKQGKFKPFLLQNLKLVGAYFLIYILWNIIGGGLKEPTTPAASLIVVVYGLLLLLILGQWILFVQLTHKQKTFKKAKKAWKKQWKHGLLWSGAWLIYSTLAYFVVISSSTASLLTQYLLFIVLAVGVIMLYTIWQEKLYL